MASAAFFFSCLFPSTKGELMQLNLIGRRIVAMRPLTDGEMDHNFWDGLPPVALELDDGTVIYPSSDAEGNRPGELFVNTPGGLQIILAVCAGEVNEQ